MSNSQLICRWSCGTCYDRLPKLQVISNILRNNRRAAVLMPSTWAVNDGLTAGLDVARPDTRVFVEDWSLLTKICEARWAVYRFFGLLPAKCTIGSMAGPSRASSVTLLPNVHVSLNQPSAPDGSCTPRSSLPIDTPANQMHEHIVAWIGCETSLMRNVSADKFVSLILINVF